MATLDTSYSFEIEDYTAPAVVAAVALDLQRFRVTFNEAIDPTTIAVANWQLDRLGDYVDPVVSASITSVTVVSDTQVDIGTDIPLTPNGNYRLTATSITDVAGNVIAGPSNTADFQGWVPPQPGARAFDLYKKLPQINRDEDDTQDLYRLIACFQEVTTLLLYDIDRFTDILDPDTATEDVLDAMLVDLGNPFDFVPDLSVTDKRRLVQLLVDIYRQKGTAVGIVSAVRLLLGIELTINAFNTDGSRWVLGVSRLGSNTKLGSKTSRARYAFRVVARGQSLTDDQRTKIQAIVEYMKPAHTHLLGIDDLGQDVLPPSITSLEVVGYPSVGGYLVPEEIPSGENVPTPAVVFPSQSISNPTSIASAEAFGTALVAGSILFMNPGLRLSLTTAVPVTTSDVTGATTLYYTPYLNGLIVTYDSGVWQQHFTPEVSLALGTLTSGRNYDVFAYWNGSAIALELSAAWTNDTTRADAIAAQDGVPVKSTDHSRRLVGTIRTTSTTTTEDSLSKRFVFNYYNRVNRAMKIVDTTDSWTYTNPNSVWRQARAQAANQVQYVTGDVGTDVEAESMAMASTLSDDTYACGVGIDSSTVNSATTYGSGTSSTPLGQARAKYRGSPGLGYHEIRWLETGPSNAASYTFYGDNGSTVVQTGLTARVAA